MNLETFISLIRKKKSAYSACFTDDGGAISRAGAIVINDIIDFTKPFATTQVLDAQGRVDPIASAAREGQRSVYLHLIKQLHLNDEQIITMTQQLQNKEV